MNPRHALAFLLLFQVSAILPLTAAKAPQGPAEAYASAIQALDLFIAAEVKEKRLPALSIALVDDQQIVWSKGYGFEDPKARRPAAADTVYRIGSVSKLFTDIGVMQLAERGELDIDAPVTRYLPNFSPKNPFDKPITLRQLMAHRSGLCREPPVGHYFDPTEPKLAELVASLNQTELIYEPGTRTKYSNGGISVAGYVLEVTQKEPFTSYIQRAVIDRFGMKQSSFVRRPEQARRQAPGIMWTYHGREFPAPDLQFTGMYPAANMYSTMEDLCRFGSALFAGGKGVIKKETLEEMWKPQFAPPGARRGFGIGFALGELEGKRKVGHGGAVYGYATELALLPDEKLGVAVSAAVDFANSAVERIADTALSHLLAVKAQKPLPRIDAPRPLEPELARRLAGRYRGFELSERGGRLVLDSLPGGFQAELRRLGEDALVTDDRGHHGFRIDFKEGKLLLRGQPLEPLPDEKPPPPPERWRGLIGEYGWDYDVLYILERGGKLHALIEWFCLYPLEELSPDVFKFPAYGLYHDEKLVFKRDAAGKAVEVVAASVPFKRRKLDGEEGATFRIKPLRPIAALRREALASTPPAESGSLEKPDLVEIIQLDPTIKLDIRYAGDNNFLSTPVYQSPRAFLQRPAAQDLVRVHQKLKNKGYGLLIHDGYRPWWVTKVFWEATPEANRIFVANPLNGSRHNRGCAVDLTLFDLKSGEPIQMVGGYDEMSDRSYPFYPGGTSEQRWHRDLLRRAMAEEGFAVYEAEWWHFDYKDWKKYPILNADFEDLGK